MLVNVLCFIAGSLLGGTLGVVVMCLCVAAGDEDKRMGLK